MPARTADRLLTGYRPSGAAYDELCAPDASVRPQWSHVMGALAALGPSEIDQRRREAHRMLRDNGVTYNVYEDTAVGERLWTLDPIPAVLTAAEWQPIARALVQRATLLEMILADLYGPHTLVRRGLIPAEIVYGHAGFARPCVGMAPPRCRSLPFYAADLARQPDGSFCVLGDRTQSPSGAGYALENRVVLSRAVPSLFRDARVHRLPPFFREVRAAFGALAPRSDDSPHVVLLTPGPGNETYFEHAFLANYLGCTLVQGDDLTVRDQRVWLRTLEGLRPVDVIVRRVDGAYCDPLELRGDSLLGTPGLLQAARQGAVALINPVGSSVVENPALMAYLPHLARELLGEDLELPSVRTWWCGERGGRAYVLEHLERLVVKPIRRGADRPTVFGGALDAAQRREVADAITATPHAFIGQERVDVSTAPAFVDARLEPRAMVLRTFLVATGASYSVMPGGLCRIAAGPDSWVVSNQRGGGSKDLWVLAMEAEPETSLFVAADRPVPLLRGGQEVPRRVADDLFWVGRYAERADAGARVLREAVRRVLDVEATATEPQLVSLLRAVTGITGTWPGFLGSGAAERLAAPEAELRAVLFDARRTGSLRFNIAALVRAGRGMRDRFSTDTWRVISAFDREFHEPHDLDAALDRLDGILLLLAAFGGLSADSMSRGQRWRFLEIGRRLERALTGVRLLRSFCPPGTEASVVPWEALLTIADASVTYRRRYRSTADPGAAVDLIVDDETNPRSVVYQLLQLAALLDGLAEPHARPARADALVSAALATLRRTTAADLAQARQLDGALDETLSRVQELLSELSDELARSYFSQGAAPRQLVGVA